MLAGKQILNRVGGESVCGGGGVEKEFHSRMKSSDCLEGWLQERFCGLGK